jgi:hypothetical protein
MQWTGGVLCVRTGDRPGRIAAAIRRLAQKLDPVVMVTEVRTLEENLDEALLQQRFVATLGAFFGAVALLLAAIADPARVLWMMLRDSLVMLALGAPLGFLAGGTLMKYVESLLFGIKAYDPLTVGAAVLTLLAVTVVAAYLPARRATRIQPIDVLKAE